MVKLEQRDAAGLAANANKNRFVFVFFRFLRAVELFW